MDLHILGKINVEEKHTQYKIKETLGLGFGDASDRIRVD